ncbi:MAG: SusC/RagA family protein [Bacteroidetes bacterium GWD2_45_23]|nr:MAG: SusC/RagA family protein [Bacteroidetes bacterium GWC2_46_850]OFX74908.1 MAG: SusC/RagA family protein [Bacteroidetes bacterium GWC1_47_7]OFX86227.1 MAG: SusC/RagA family protein [Bacteroidetes bacterium GWD2_45_23]HAR37933.1 SusC/RagA family protein [Porphyromonadaceae bacterium]HCC17363.1 SusC/RagA family protein [Porphyromonadaceae bacterium]
MNKQGFLFLWTLLLCLATFYPSNVLAQQIQVTGKVRDAKTNEPLIGVSIVVRGTGTGYITDVNGEYKMNISSDDILEFSYIGYHKEEIPVNGKGVINVSMSEDLKMLEEVVIVGFGAQKKVNLTGAVGTLGAEALENRPVQSATQALQGLIGGLNITQTNGSLEDKSKVNIRGIGTIDSGSTSSPLVLIDGMEGDLNAVNPQDIENISVLKDASSSSIYGSRAAFGVILITTKKGSSGKIKLNYNNNFRWTTPVIMPKMMDSYTFALYFNDAGINGGSTPYYSEERLQRILDYQSGKLKTSIMPNPTNPQYWAEPYGNGNDNVDWYDALYKDYAFSHEHNISLTGGTEVLSFYLSGNFLNQEGLMELNKDTYERYSATAKIYAKLNEWTSINYTNRFYREDFRRPSALSNTLYTDLGRQGWPTLPLYDPNGYLFTAPSPALGLSDGGEDNHQYDWMNQQLQIILEPIKDWKIFGDLNYRTRNNFRHWDTQRLYNHDVNGNPYVYSQGSGVYEYGYRENYFNPNVYSEYLHTYSDKHTVKVMAGFQSELNKYRDLSAKRDGIIVPSIPTLNTTSGTAFNGNPITPSVTGQYQNWATVGFFGRINYNYLERYLMEFNLRYDGTSRFRREKRWNWFPSVSVGWNVAREAFWQPFEHIVGTFKLRTSYGQLGNQNTGNWYPTYLTMPIGTANGDWLIGGLRPNTANAPGLVSSSLTWETVKSYNFGLDVAMFDNRLNASIDVFNRQTQNMVGPAPELPLILGTAVPKVNNTDLETKGFEVDIDWQDRLSNGLGYNIRFLLSDYQTEVTRYPNPTNSLTTYREGQKLGEIWGYTTIGIAKTDEEMRVHLATLPDGGQNAFGTIWTAGDIMYKDLNSDGKIDSGANTTDDSGDMSIIGNNTPRFAFGLDLGVDWKGFDIRAFFQGIMKRDFWQGSYFFWGASGSGIWWSTGMQEHIDYFRADSNHPLGQNIDSYYPRPLFRGQNQQTQTRYLQNAAYIRLKNLQLGYTLPQELTRNFNFEKFRVFISGENLWIGTKMAKMFDPETVEGGYGGNVYPMSKVMSVGLNINF